MDIKAEALKNHYEWNGKIEIISRAEINTREDLALAYTPGVAEPCLVIAKDEEKAYELTRKNNLVAVITDGTAVLGLGDIGPSAAMPVMEGKCALFKAFADVDAFPICVDSHDVDTIVETIANISKSFGGINLEDISAPRCFEVEAKLKKRCDIPVFHDDQHGTAIVVAAALINALKVTGKNKDDITVVINGAGAAGTAIAKLLLQLGLGEIILCDKDGIIYDGADWLSSSQKEMSKLTNKKGLHGVLCDAIKLADVFIGVSRPGLLTAKMVADMNKNAIIFALANPTPEIMPDEAKQGGAAVVGTGRSDFPNQINNVLAFPGIFKGALRVRASDITEGMKVAAAFAIANMVSNESLNAEHILPDALDKSVAEGVANAVAAEAVKEGISRI
ncbi:MAG: NADP-dependent malic enzyme [Hydrogenoanaerobacterium sp.]